MLEQSKLINPNALKTLSKVNVINLARALKKNYTTVVYTLLRLLIKGKVLTSNDTKR